MKKPTKNHDAILLEIGDRLNQLMFNKRLRAYNLAEDAGISRSVLYKIFNGRQVTTRSLLSVMEALDVDPASLECRKKSQSDE